MSDVRTIHAEHGDKKIVRYTLAGRWYQEYQPADLRSSELLTALEAARRAIHMEKEGGTIYLGRPGGKAFDAAVKSMRTLKAGL